MNDSNESAPSAMGRRLLAGAFAVAATVGAGDAAAALDMFIKIADIKGESFDKTHKDEIDVLAWSWGVVGPTLAAKTKDSQPGCSAQFSFTSYLDRSAPPLMAAAALNTPIPTATLTVRKAGENQLEVLRVDLSGVTVRSVTTGGSGGEDRLTDNVALAFTSAKIQYTPENPNGTPGTKVSADLPGSCP
jgi:type VI secretion system secreted protein Hcp